MNFVSTSAAFSTWVDNTPKNWRTDWLKWHVSLSTRRPSEGEAEKLPYISNEDIESWTGRLLRTDPQPSDADGRLFAANDVLFNKLRPYLAKVYHAQFDGISSGELLCLKPSKDVASRFLFYVVSSKAFIDAVDAETFGSKMPRADWEIVGHQPLPLPSLDTQKRIAGFLDEKTALIDALIAKKQALLERLVEKRQAIITQAVTKGLNPTASMRDSGIEWLGQIPAHWKILPLKRLLEDAIGLQMGPFGGMLTNLPDYETGYRLYGQENTISGDFSVGRRWIEEERYKELERYKLQEGDLVITRKGSLGHCRRVPGDILPGIADSDTIRIRPDHTQLLPEWALLLLHEAQFVSEQIAAQRRGAILSGLNTTVVGSLLFTVPPIAEQSAIIQQIGQQTNKIRYVEAAIKTSISKLIEYRSALITSAVTGNITSLQ